MKIITEKKFNIQVSEEELLSLRSELYQILNKLSENPYGDRDLSSYVREEFPKFNNLLSVMKALPEDEDLPF